MLFRSIEVSPRPQGEVQVRLSGRVRDLVWTLLGLESEQRAESKGHLHLWGDANTLNGLRYLLQEFNLRSAAGQWLKSHWPLNMLWQKLSQQDLSWLEDLQPLPNLIKQTREEIATLKIEVQQQQKTLAIMQQTLQKQLAQTRLLLGLVTTSLVVGIVGLILR